MARLGVSELHAACRAGDLERVLALVTLGEALAVDAKDNCGRSPLSVAAAGGHIDLVDLLLDIGASADAADDTEERDTPLIAAAKRLTPSPSISESNDHAGFCDALLRIARALLDAGAGVDTRNAATETALFHAASAGDEAFVQLLLTREADVDGVRWDRSPLFGACVHGHVRMVHVLLDEGGEVFIVRGKSMEELLFLAAANGDADMVKLLLHRGASIHPEYGSNRSALHIAAARGHAAIVHLLLEAGADPETQNHDCQSALHVAAANGQVAAVGALIEHAANVNNADYGGTTPLHLAAQHGRPEVVARLLDGGAVDDNGDGYRKADTALDIAASYHHVEVVQLLLARGVDVGTIPYNYRVR